MKALFTYDYGEKKMNQIAELGYDVMVVHEKLAKVDDRTKDAEVLVCYNPFVTLDIKKMTELKWVQLTSIGIDQAPLAYIKEKNIILTNNKGGYSIPMGEFIVMKILELYKNSRGLYLQQQQKKWHMDTSIKELYGKTVGFIGTGSIATEAAKRLQGFGVHIEGINTSGSPVEFFHKCYPMSSIKNTICNWDVMVLTIPHTNMTHHLINASIMDKMKKEATIINVSRGSIIDEKAIAQYLHENRIHAAALDVFEKEPLDHESPLWNLENVILTPHNSWISEMRDERRFQMIYDNMKRYIQHERLHNMVDLIKGY